MNDLYISLDQGTTSSRTLLFDDQFNLIDKSQQEFSQILKNEGWVEHNPEEILSSQIETLKEIVSRIEANKKLIAGIANQRETIIAWDKSTGKPFYNAIVWQDTRTNEFCTELKNNNDIREKIHRKTGLIVDSYFSASKMKWILDNVPDAKIAHENDQLLFGTVDSWLIWNLTEDKNHFTDVSNASRTMLMNIENLDWDEELLELFGIKKSALPKICPNDHYFGSILIEGKEIELRSVAGDQQAALFGQQCFSAGQAKNTYGTGCFLLMNTGKITFSENGLLSTVGWQINDETTYALEGSVFVAGSGIQWLRDQLMFFEEASESEQMALSSEETDLVFVPAFAGLGAPHWDMTAKGMLIGITRDTTRAEITRAMLESIAFQTKDVIKAMEMDAQTEIDHLLVDGGASLNKYLMQFQSEIIQKEIFKPSETEATAKGVAMMAAISSGNKNFNDFKNQQEFENIYSPTLPLATVEKKYHLWLEATNRCKNWPALC